MASWPVAGGHANVGRPRGACAGRAAGSLGEGEGDTAPTSAKGVPGGAGGCKGGEGERGGHVTPPEGAEGGAVSSSKEAKTVVKPRVQEYAGAGSAGSKIRVGDHVTVAYGSSSTRWQADYAGSVGQVMRWWTPHNPGLDNRCVVSFPAPIGLRIFTASMLLPAAHPAASASPHRGPPAMRRPSASVPPAVAVGGGGGTVSEQVKLKAVDYVLNAVVRNTDMRAQQKLLTISTICGKPYGDRVCQCLAGNGCNPETRALDGCPVWDRAAHQLCKLLSIEGVDAAEAAEARALASAPPQRARGGRCKGDGREAKPSFVEVKDRAIGESHGAAVEFSAVGGMLLQDAVRVASLTSLDLSSQKLTSVCLPMLVEPLLRGDCLALKHLSLASNPLQDVGAMQLLPLLDPSSPHRCRLESLDVSNCMIWTRGCIAIARALRGNSHLLTLLLGGNDAGSPTCDVVADVLRTNDTLQKLDLSVAGITPPGMERLALALPHNSSLRHLDVGGNLPQYDVRVWQRGLVSNSALSFLNLPYCAMMPDASLELVVAQVSSLDIVLRVEMRLALCMGLHDRLGANSLLHHMSENVVFDILRFTWVPRTITVEPRELHMANQCH